MLRERASRPAALLLALLVLLLLEAPACVTTAIEGAQIASPPSGLGFDPNCSAARKVLRDRDTVRQRCYVGRGESPDWITITEFKGTTARRSVEDARTDASQRYRDHVLGALEDIRVDGREAWGWTTSTTYKGKVTSLGYVAVVAYPAATYSIEFDARSARNMDPALVRSTVRSFTVRRSRDVDWRKVLLALVLLAGGVLAARRVAAMHREPVRKPRVGERQRPRGA